MRIGFDELILGPKVEFSFILRNNMDGTKTIIRWSEPEKELGKIIEHKCGSVTVISSPNEGYYTITGPWVDLLKTPQGIIAALDRADLNSPYYL